MKRLSGEKADSHAWYRRVSLSCQKREVGERYCEWRLQGHHSCAKRYAGVVAALDDELFDLARGSVEGLLRSGYAGGGFDGDADYNVVARCYAAVDSSGIVGRGPAVGRDDRVVVCEPVSVAPLNPLPNSTPLTAGIENNRCAATLSTESKKGSPQPASHPLAVHSITPPTESPQAMASSMTCRNLVLSVCVPIETMREDMRTLPMIFFATAPAATRPSVTRP